MAAWIWNKHHKVVDLDPGYIAKLERGVLRRPTDRYRQGIPAVLDVDTDEALDSGRAIH